MARLPQYRSQLAGQSAAPTVARQVDTSLGRNVQQLAGAAAQLAGVQNQMMEREARDYTLTSQNKTTVGLAEQKETLVNSAQTGSEYADGVNKYLESQKQKAVEAAPNQKAAEAVTVYYDTLAAQESKTAIGVSAKINARNTAAATKEAFNISFNDTLKTPNRFDANLEKGVAIILTSDIPENQKAAAVTAYENELTYYKYRGLVSQDPKKVLDDLSGDASTNANLTPKQTLQLTNMATQQVKSKAAVSKQKVGTEISNYLAYKNSGGAENREFSDSALKTIYGEEEGAALYAQIKDAESFADNYNKVRLADPDEIAQLIDAEVVTGPEDFKTQSAQQGVLVKAINERNKQLTADPAKYVMQSDTVNDAYALYTETGDGSSYAQTTIAEQKRLGVPSDFTTVLTKQQAGQMVGQYQQGDESAAEFMQTLRDQFGDYFPNVVRDLTGAGLSPNAATVAVLPSGSRGATYLAQADKEGYKALKETLPDDDYKEITTTVMDELGDFDSTSYSVGTRNQVKQSTELLAMKYLSSGVYDNPSDAVEAAANDVVNSRYEFQDGYRVPIERNAYLIETGVDRIIPALIDMDLMPPRSTTLPPDVALESYKSSLKPKAVTLNDDSGVVMYDNQNEPILDANGNLIIYTWDELEKSAEDDKYLPLRRGR